MQIASGQVNLTISPIAAPAPTPDTAAATSPAALLPPHNPPLLPRRWPGMRALASTQIVAVQNGRQIRWDKPITFDLDVHPTEHGPAIDNVTCESDFLRIRAAGTAASGLQLKFDGDLAGSNLGWPEPPAPRACGSAAD